jgi:hypothetical protein
MCLNNKADAAKYVGVRLLASGIAGVEVTEEMAGAVQVYLDAVRGDLGDPSPEVELLIEHQFDLSRLHPGMFGTCDAVIIYKHAGLIRVFDYKHGQGVPVEVKDNPQLMYYALGALLTITHPVTEVEMVVVQPRCSHRDGPVRRHRIPAIELLDFSTDLIEYAKATEAPDAPLVPGDHCRFCPAAATCPALERQAAEAFTASLVEAEPKTFDGARLADWLGKLDVIEGWCKAIREAAYAEASAGHTIPGFKLVQKEGRRAWLDAQEVEKWIRKHAPEAQVLMYASPELLSPAQMQKLAVFKGKDNPYWAKLSELCPKKSAGTALVPESDSRPAYSVADSFNAVQGGE